MNGVNNSISSLVFEAEVGDLCSNIAKNATSMLASSTRSQSTDVRTYLRDDCDLNLRKFQQLDAKTEILLNCVVEKAFKMMTSSTDVKNFLVHFCIEDDLLRDIMKCASFSLIKNFVDECNTENPQLVDAMIKHFSP